MIEVARKIEFREEINSLGVLVPGREHATVHAFRAD
jgi:hypothetical protein